MPDANVELGAGFTVNNASTVGTSAAAGNDPILIPSQRSAFYTARRRWVFFTDGTNLVFRSSVDGFTWSAATNVRACVQGDRFAIHFDGTYVHYAYSCPTAGPTGGIWYRRGAPQSNGTITWSAVEQKVTEPGEANNIFSTPSVSVDSAGYPWITWLLYDDDGPAYRLFGVRSQNNDGTWSGAEGGDSIRSGMDATSCSRILPLPERKMYCLYDRAGEISGKPYTNIDNPTDWDSEEDTGADVPASRLYDAVSHGGHVHLVWTEAITLKLQHRQRVSGTGAWSASHEIYDAVLADMGPALSIGSAEVDPVLYVFWAPDEANPTADHIFYKFSTNLGVAWSAIVDWIDDSADTFPLPNQQSSFNMQGEFYIGCVWVRSSPDDIRYFEVEFSMANGSESLAAGFEVGQGSADLAAGFNAAALNEELPAGLIVRQAANQNLPAEFIVRQPGSVELSAGFIVRQADSVDFLGELIVRQADSVDFLGEFIVRQSGSVDFLGEFIVRQSGSVELSAGFIVRHPGSVNLLGEFISRQAGSANLAAGFIVRHPGSVNLLSEFISRQAGSANLAAAFVVRHTATPFEIAAKFAVRQIYPYWTSRRLINGVVDNAENLMGDAILETVMEGVMDDIKVWCDAEDVSYTTWLNFDTAPRAMKRATTYGCVAALYARYSKTWRGRVIPTVAPVTITVAGDDEKAMTHWQEKMQDMLDRYLAAQDSPNIYVSTADEEPVFTMDDIPQGGSDRELTEWQESVYG